VTSSTFNVRFQEPSANFADALPADTQPGRTSAAIFGAPLDRTTSFRSGTAGGPSGIREMSWDLESYSPALDRDTQDLTVVDLGDLQVDKGSMPEALHLVADAMEHAASSGRLGIMIGGEHTATLGGYRGIKRLHPDAMLIQADAHLDMRDQYEGERITHASWVYHAGEEFDFQDFVQVGVRSGAREEWPRARDWMVWSNESLVLPESVRGRLAERPVYLTIDIDVLDPAYAPGTGSPEPGGCTFRELVAFVHGLKAMRVVGLDVVEVSPGLDHSGITSVAAAKLIREAVLLFGVSE
jgi:agmatinase